MNRELLEMSIWSFLSSRFSFSSSSSWFIDIFFSSNSSISSIFFWHRDQFWIFEKVFIMSFLYHSISFFYSHVWYENLPFSWLNISDMFDGFQFFQDSSNLLVSNILFVDWDILVGPLTDIFRCIILSLRVFFDESLYFFVFMIFSRLDIFVDNFQMFCCTCSLLLDLSAMTRFVFLLLQLPSFPLVLRPSSFLNVIVTRFSNDSLTILI